ncbi:unnamed protein product [Brachionus calyciflorus]|uniref:Uncharacterized protein n=1 Tax=Brachionus calyciflorus TaxID=104777 RepID=A0A814GT62_9BILA|nr:unnamed protein product [Brachionus calyciflorus]
MFYQSPLFYIILSIILIVISALIFSSAILLTRHYFQKDKKKFKLLQTKDLISDTEVNTIQETNKEIEIRPSIIDDKIPIIYKPIRFGRLNNLETKVDFYTLNEKLSKKIIHEIPKNEWLTPKRQQSSEFYYLDKTRELSIPQLSTSASTRSSYSIALSREQKKMLKNFLRNNSFRDLDSICKSDYTNFIKIGKLKDSQRHRDNSKSVVLFYNANQSNLIYTIDCAKDNENHIFDVEFKK